MELVPDSAAAPPQKPPAQEKGIKYEVDIKTGDDIGSGTDSNVFLSIFGDKGDLQKVHLHTAKNNKNKFEKGGLDKFDLELKDVGKVHLTQKRVFFIH